jgi:membrane-associated phospholipid phosphatase
MKKISIWLRSNRHAWWSLCLPYIIFMFLLPERLVTADYWVSYVPLDDYIPFFPPFVVFYLPMVSHAFLYRPVAASQDGDGFRKYMLFMSLAYTLGAAIYILFPNGRTCARPPLRRGTYLPALSAGFTGSIRTRTSFRACMSSAASASPPPSMNEDHKAKVGQGPDGLLSLLVMLSTVFIKQHSVLDLAAGLVYGAMIYVIIYVFIFGLLKTSGKNKRGKARQ